ncbi:DedA family protein [Archangium violaceum]|uniref:DedA family protein n=1 Tax=Archangium violaceum TaxID=83451 RepID=UPI0019508215|nr:DedA family protein [Archangium violaceum]QRN92857.1 DedA family protein [Archangium violaceum]
MQEFLTNLLGSTHGFLAYAAVFGVLVACGLGVPLPEDISLILGGFLAHKGAASLPAMMLIGFAGILVGDSLIFMAGRRLGSQVGRSPTGFFARVVTPEKRARVEGMFALHGQKIVMIARFLPGVRAVTYFTAGSAGMSYWRFIFWDGLAALLSAPFFVWLGFHFGDKLDYGIELLKDGQMVVLGGLVVVGLVFFLWRKRIASVRDAALKAAVKASPVPAHLLTGATEASSATAPVFEMADQPKDRLHVRD